MKAYYERYWEELEELSDFKYKWPKISKYIPTKKTIAMLDFGCGKGSITKELAKINPTATITGVDVSSEALRFTRKAVPSGRFIKITDGGKLPFRERSFDFIIASDVLEHVYDTENAFFEIGRVLKKGGSLLISVPYNGILKRTLIALFFFENVYEPSTPHIRSYTKNTLTKYLEKNKIQVEEVGYYGRFYPLSNGMFIVGKKRH